MIPSKFKIIERKEKRPDCITLTLEPEDSTACEFKPGQFYMMYSFGHGEVPISISGDYNNNKQLTFTIKNVGSVTNSLYNSEAGTTLGLRGPFGNHWPTKELADKDIIIMAGGLGIAPLRSAIYHFVNNREKYKNIYLLYGAKSPKNYLFNEELDRWQRNADIQVLFAADEAPPSWDGHIGFVNELLDRLDINPQNSSALVCGPEVMMKSSAKSLVDKGLNSQDIFLSIERNMKCAIGHCGRCQMGANFICKDGTIFSLDQVKHLLDIREL